MGYNNNNIDTSIILIKYLDLYVGLPSILYDKDVRRRSLYGKAGCFRLTSYGLEYRCLSAAMYANEDLMKIVWKGVINAIDAFNAKVPLPNAEAIQSAINNSNEELAKKIMDKYGIAY